MDITIKVSPANYEKLRQGLPHGSPAYEAIEKATWIEHAVSGVLFEGYDISCDEKQASVLLETARRCCPSAVHDIEKAIAFAK
ncbi:MAG TPA: hypothetical protein VL754_09075 [Verrucomicrobiae bacterium]|jgi:hypothetical protein|nr:hypothetical protein [Verrucomicrobiae bacterium]